jgi:hypothetical protein
VTKKTCLICCTVIALFSWAGCSGTGLMEESGSRLPPAGPTAAVELARSPSGLVIVWSDNPTGIRSRHALVAQKAASGKVSGSRDSLESRHCALIEK